MCLMLCYHVSPAAGFIGMDLHSWTVIYIQKHSIHTAGHNHGKYGVCKIKINVTQLKNYEHTPHDISKC